MMGLYSMSNFYLKRVFSLSYYLFHCFQTEVSVQFFYFMFL